MKMWENISLSLVPSVWSQQYRLELIESPLGFDWAYAIVCDHCDEIKFAGYADECDEWLNPMLIRPCPN